jgi:predicted DsbA family dithiol-disulfide isomerase
MHVHIWSDVVCPWCYVGKRRFETALATFRGAGAGGGNGDITVTHRSFQLDPSSPRGQTTDRRQMLKRKYGWSDAQADEMDARMTHLAAIEGLDYHLDGGVTGNTLDAHQIVHLAKAHGRQDAAVERLYRAHFTERRSIFDHASLAALAAEAGLDAGEAQRVLREDVYAAAVAADLAEAHRLGISGVPFFVLDGRFGISGAQPVETFMAAFERAAGD